MNLPILSEPPSASAEPSPELVSYSYSYPHKSSYQPLNPAVRLGDIWKGQFQEPVALYVHVPFCEMRCGFCNLFTRSQPSDDLCTAYLNALDRQIVAVNAEVRPYRIAQFALGGGTPTLLSSDQLAWLLDRVEQVFGFTLRSASTSVEVSPTTISRQKLQVLVSRGIERISIGIQSFHRDDLRQMGRPLQLEHVDTALHLLRECQVPRLNLDLIYGVPGQSASTWEYSLNRVLEYAPEEIYLYPLYIRPETGLARTPAEARLRQDLYRLGRDRLCGAGYRQLSLRSFVRRADTPASEFSCQRNGMIGLGCGARSYTQRLHYSTRFAVTQPGIQAILNDWISQSDEDFRFATHGYWLNDQERRRRTVILCLLQAEGLSLEEYRDQFGTFPDDDFPILRELMDRGWIWMNEDRLVLSQQGMEYSDEIGPRLYSRFVQDRLQEFTRR